MSARVGTRIYENSIEIRIRPVQVGNAVCASEKENENVENCSRREKRATSEPKMFISRGDECVCNI